MVATRGMLLNQGRSSADLPGVVWGVVPDEPGVDTDTMPEGLSPLEEQELTARLNRFRDDMNDLLQRQSVELLRGCEMLCAKLTTTTKQFKEAKLIQRHGVHEKDTVDALLDEVLESSPERHVNPIQETQSKLKAASAASATELKASKLATLMPGKLKALARAVAFTVSAPVDPEQSEETKHHENQQISMLRDAIIATEVEEEEILREKHTPLKDKIARLDRVQIELMIDSSMIFFILANALFLGFSMDLEAYNSGQVSGWNFVDLFFTTVFLSELITKVFLHGCSHFKHVSNLFDTLVVIFDLLSVVGTFSGFSTGVDVSLFRVIRLGKLTRIVRVLRHEGFYALLAMIQGMIGGMSTLLWSIVVYFLTVYVTSLLFREWLGREEKNTVYELFNSVPRSMLTTFRCSFGDCSAPSGVPIFEHVQLEYGTLGRYYSLFYCGFVFVMTIGLFNVISAIFVESTLSANQKFHDNVKTCRLKDELRWSTRFTTLIKRLMYYCNGEVPEKLSEVLADVYALEVEVDVIREWSKDPETIAALRDLDVDPQDYDELYAILDPDNSGTIKVTEVQEGLRRLRGFTRRSDILRIDLMVKSLQRTAADIITVVRNNNVNSENIARMLVEIREVVLKA